MQENQIHIHNLMAVCFDKMTLYCMDKDIINQPIIDYLIDLDEDVRAEDLFRRMLVDLQKNSLQSLYKDFLYAGILGVPPQKWVIHTIDAFSLINKQVKGLSYQRKISYIFAILSIVSAEASKKKTFKQDKLRSLLKNILQRALKYCSTLNRERDNEITTELKQGYFSHINKYLYQLIATICQPTKELQEKLQLKLEHLWCKEDELTFKKMIIFVDLFSKISLFFENQYLGTCQKMKQALVNAFSIQDRGPKWISFTNLVVWIQNRIVCERKESLIETGLQIIKRIIDKTIKELIPTLNAMNTEGKNLLTIIVVWDLILEIFKIYEYLEEKSKKTIHDDLQSLIKLTKKHLPQPEIQELERGNFKNYKFVNFYFQLCQFQYYSNHKGNNFTFLNHTISQNYLLDNNLLPPPKQRQILKFQLTEQAKRNEIKHTLVSALKKIFFQREEDRLQNKKIDPLKERKFQIYLLVSYAISIDKFDAIRQFLSEISPMEEFILHKFLICNFHLFNNKYLFLVIESSLNVLRKLYQATISSFDELNLLCIIIQVVQICCYLLMGKPEGERSYAIFFCTNCEGTTHFSVCRICESMGLIFRWRQEDPLWEYVKNYHKRFLDLCERMRGNQYLDNIDEKLRSDLVIILNTRSQSSYF